MNDKNNAIKIGPDASCVAELGGESLVEYGLQQSSRNFVSAPEQLRSTSLFGPFSSVVVAKFVSTSARSLGLPTPA